MGRPVALPAVLPSAMLLRRSNGVTPRSGTRNTVPVTDGPDLPGRRTGRRQLQRLGDSLSERDLAVLGSVAAHRFLTTRQVEGLHFLGHASALSGARCARRVLRRLRQLGLLRPLERRIGGVRAGSAGYVWSLSSAGERLLAARVDGQHRRRSHEPSARLLDHCLAIADAHVRLAAAEHSGKLELLSLELEPNSWRRFMGAGGEARLLRPDLFVITGTSEFEDHWFVEVDLGTEHPPTLVRKCRLYVDYRASGREQQRYGIFPRVIWQVRDQARVDRLAEAFGSARLDTRLLRVITAEALVPTLQEGAG